MPISSAERARIVRDSREPADREGYVSPFATGNTDLDSDIATIQAAVVFSRRIAALLSDVATDLAEAGSAKINAGQELASGRETDQFMWARDYQVSDAEAAMKKLIDHFGETNTKAQVFGQSDAALHGALLQFVVPALAALVANKRR